MRRFLLCVIATTVAIVNVASEENISYGIKTIVIDAGHGGKFPGTCPPGYKEKDIALKVALELGKLIEKQMPGVKVIYTRKTDKELSTDRSADLEARAVIANKANADLFISIHGNAAKSPSVKGIETLIMGESTAEQRKNEAMLYANNRDDLFEIPGGQDDPAWRAYFQARQITYGEYSRKMAHCVQERCRKGGRPVRDIRPQIVHVLCRVDMPSVLVEIGFMSNPDEMKYLASTSGQEDIAKLLFASVKDYSDMILHERAVRGGRTPSDSSSKPSNPSAPSAPATPPADTTAAPATATPEAPATTPATAAPAPTTPAAAASDAQTVYHAIQILATTKPLSASSGELKEYKGQAAQYSGSGTAPYKYCVGRYADRAEAQKMLAKVRKTFPGAFLVKCRGTEIVK